MKVGSESADDCSGWLLPNYYYKPGTGVLLCEEDFYCPGGEKYKGKSVDTGMIACPAGTNSVAGKSAIGDCNTLKAGFYYDGTGAISASTVKTCAEGFFCATEGKLINDGSVTLSTDGFTKCPDGTSSTPAAYPAAGPKEANDCKRLLAGFQFEGTQISDSKVSPCPADTYFGSERPINLIFAALPCDKCPEGTGVAAPASDATPGALTANACKKLYEGYWYNGVDSGDISTLTVKPCPAGKFCPGWPKTDTKIDKQGIPVLPRDCPDGTSVAAGTARTIDWWDANNDARAITAAASGSTATSAGNGAKVSTDCKTLLAGWWFKGSTKTVDQCPADSYCVGGGTFTSWTGTSDVGQTACPTGSGSSIGAKIINDCNKLKPAYYFSGGATVSGGSTGSIKPCEAKFYW